MNVTLHPVLHVLFFILVHVLKPPCSQFESFSEKKNSFWTTPYGNFKNYLFSSKKLCLVIFSHIFFAIFVFLCSLFLVLCVDSDLVVFAFFGCLLFEDSFLEGCS